MTRPTFALAYERLRLALEESIRRFAIRRVDALAFHDYYGLVPPAEIHRLLREVAGATRRRAERPNSGHRNAARPLGSPAATATRI